MPGSHTIYVYAHSPLNGWSWNTVTVNLQGHAMGSSAYGAPCLTAMGTCTGGYPGLPYPPPGFYPPPGSLAPRPCPPIFPPPPGC